MLLLLLMLKEITLNKLQSIRGVGLNVSATFAIMCLIYDTFHATNAKIMHNSLKRSSRN